MPDNPTSDEALAFACSCNDDASYAKLYERYYNPIGFYVKKNSVYKDRSFIDDTRGIIFFKVLSALKQGRFTPKFPGSFKKYLFETAQKTIFDENQKRLRIVRPITEVFTEEELLDPDGLAYREVDPDDYEEIEERAKAVLSKLNSQEQRLVQLAFVEEMPYEKIIDLPEFKHYKTVDSLKKKIYRIKKRLKKTIKMNVTVIRPGQERPEVEYCPLYIAFAKA